MSLLSCLFLAGQFKSLAYFNTYTKTKNKEFPYHNLMTFFAGCRQRPKHVARSQNLIAIVLLGGFIEFMIAEKIRVAFT